MANKGTQEGQCQSGTADLAESVLDCLSTGMEITLCWALLLCSFQPFPLWRPRRLFLLMFLLFLLDGNLPLPLKFKEILALWQIWFTAGSSIFKSSCCGSR